MQKKCNGLKIVMAFSDLESKYYLITSAQKVCERPKDRLGMVRDSFSSNRTGFFPIWSTSDSRTGHSQGIPVGE